MNTNRFFPPMAVMIAISLLVACGGTEDDPTQTAGPKDTLSICEQASAHLTDCTGQPMALAPDCDQAAATEILSQTCAQLGDPGKADFFRNWLCSLGFLYQCPEPVCMPPAEIAAELETTTRCAAYIGVSTCAECDYYLCREQKRAESCGEEGYYLGFARRYCMLFTENTIPRLSSQGKNWIEAVRPCLQEGMEVLSDEASCRLVSDHGYSIHPGCYVDTGFCELPVSDMLAILNTVAPQDLGTQPFTTAIQCLQRWFNPLTLELTPEGWEQIEEEARAQDGE